MKTGENAIEFSLKDKDGKIHSLKDYKGKKIILYFYPKDNTSGCTKQACGFRDLYQDFLEKNAIVIGVSPDSEKSHQKFIDKNTLQFILLSDPEHIVSEKYGVWGEKKMYGKSYMGIIRTTFIINENLIIEKVYNKVSPDKNPTEILEYLNLT